MPLGADAEGIAMEFSKTARRSAAVIAVVVWAALLTQLFLNFGKAEATGKPLWVVPLELYGYFTIWSNTLVGLICTAVARGKTGLFSRAGTLGAAVVYIIVVGVIYNTLLVQFNPQTGLRLVIDTIFHTIVPLAYPLWWAVLSPRGQMLWKAMWGALGFPLAYTFVALSRGALTGKYAYFFLDVAKYGIVQVLLNLVGLVIFFAILMALTIGFDRWRAPRRATNEATG
jgi:hypothetical protein